MLHSYSNIYRCSFSCVMALGIMDTSGCAPPTGSVCGTVTYRGKILPHGRVTFVCADGTVVSGKIEPDGTYAISPAPAGPAKVAVRSLEEAMPALITVDPSERAPVKGAGASDNGPRAPLMMRPEKSRSPSPGPYASRTIIRKPRNRG